jgi:hypothetical protein
MGVERRLSCASRGGSLPAQRHPRTAGSNGRGYAGIRGPTPAADGCAVKTRLPHPRSEDRPDLIPKVSLDHTVARWAGIPFRHPAKAQAGCAPCNLAGCLGSSALLMESLGEETSLRAGLSVGDAYRRIAFTVRGG